MRGLSAAAMLSAPLLLCANAPGEAGSLDVAVSNVRSNNGRVSVSICPESTYLKTCPYNFSAPARTGTTIVTVPGLPFGTYAAQVFHDENDNKKVDRALFGVPKEGVGFSNDAPINFAAPKFAAAKFRFAAPAQKIALKLRYFLGKQGG
ncbi:DUF2141 domain-containing protein [Novosphingobium sp. Chol11]|uniref:DUF2141 domain-containing protein n=1 Tax=Novosphingobium sp. Chol11 TaxID=1385763 RepID=UPI0025EF1F6B|nr:DUF2141 domain-containing protein [Novosphingobium sp. Chol11]